MQVKLCSTYTLFTFVEVNTKNKYYKKLQYLVKRCNHSQSQFIDIYKVMILLKVGLNNIYN